MKTWGILPQWKLGINKKIPSFYCGKNNLEVKAMRKRTSNGSRYYIAIPRFLEHRYTDFLDNNPREYAIYLMLECLFEHKVIQTPPVWNEKLKEVWLDDRCKAIRCDGKAVEILVF